MLPSEQSTAEGATVAAHDASSITAPAPRHQRRDPLTGDFIHDDVEGSDQDPFSNLAKDRDRKPRPEKPDPEKLQISSRELNTQLVQGKSLDEYSTTPTNAPSHGSSGYQWRMMKLRRVYETAEEQNRPLEEVALERYASMADFNEARAERQFIEDRSQTRGAGGSGRNTPNAASASRKGFMFSTPGGSEGGSRPSSRASFRRPGESSNPGTPSAQLPPSVSTRFQQRGFESPANGSKPGTPIPSVFTPTVPRRSQLSQQEQRADRNDLPADQATAPYQRTATAAESSSETAAPPMDATALNRLEAKVLRAELTGSSQATSLRAKLEREKARSGTGGDRGGGFPTDAQHIRPDADEGATVQVLPTLDARGRLYDVGSGQAAQNPTSITSGNRLAEKNNPDRKRFESHDKKTGERLRYNADDDEVTLAELVRQERFGAGSSDQKDMDAEFAKRIMNDSNFKNDLDYMDENVERLGRKKMKTDAMKRQFAIQDFAKTKKALDACQYCWQEEGAKPPRAPVVSSGTLCYLALPEGEALVDGHCFIVPMQHYLSSLEADDDTWDEIKNFMKCLMQMAHARQQSYIFCETVRSIKHQRHTAIEAIPVPHDLFSELPASFKQEILTVDEEWSQNKKLIEFTSARPFRKSLVPNLPHFAVMWDYKGEKGYGHIIEEGDLMEGDEDTYGYKGASKGGNTFPKYFAAEIIGQLLDLEPRQWRKPRWLDANQQTQAISAFKHKGWSVVDWTKMIGVQPN
ncbi:hypothetical protein IE81DRAFT_289722 [Ceraceosorus guamensis]|uniref:CwfJ C-terminus 1-domain-containing protein-like protein n=1 Tax=Ceraceosorus guamensis TaxID=1522189 RepID=A0A316W573_9BASI|nr:hypothetical protein IE81DRAFT_289722 [Ceraceosorus guamensis]PWN42775.1 hypothetical protein IE81DRAFT_289722 [Ceraceosorus guamensis]